MTEAPKAPAGADAAASEESSIPTVTDMYMDQEASTSYLDESGEPSEAPDWVKQQQELQEEAELEDEAEETVQEEAADEAEGADDQEEAAEVEDSYAKAFTKLRAEQKKLETEKAALADDRRRMERLKAKADQMEDEPIEFIQGLVSAFKKTDDPDVISQGIDDIYEAILAHKLGDSAPDSLKKKQNSEGRKAQKEIQKLREELAAEKAAQAEASQRAQQEAQLNAAANTVRSKIQEQAEALAHLDAEGDQGVIEVLQELHNDETLSFEDALIKVNQKFKTIFEKKYGRFAKKPDGDDVVPTKKKKPVKNLNNTDAAAVSSTKSFADIDEDELLKDTLRIFHRKP